MALLRLDLRALHGASHMHSLFLSALLSILTATTLFAQSRDSHRKFIPSPYRIYSGDDIVEEEIEESFGPRRIEKKRLKKLEVYGPTHLDHVTILGHAAVYGPLEGAHISAKTLTVHGPVSVFHLQTGRLLIKGPAMINHFKIGKEVKIYGPLNAVHGACEVINVVGRDVHLGEVKTKRLIVSSKSENPSRVELKETVISGDVIFQGTPGKVFLDESSRVTGKIKNGRLEK